IARVEDLEVVRSYGFRGEALPSIAAVAHLVLTTRTRETAVATRAVADGGTIQTLGSHGAPHGTTVEVATLFFNTPARLKFLKSPAREQALIAEAVQRAAMPHPDVAFRLVLDGRETARWPRATAAERVAQTLGAGGVDDLIAVNAAIPGGTVRGWLARPERGRPGRTGQHVFVNNRPVHSALLRRAAEQGYAQLLPVGRFPVFALFLDVDPASIDVNVHPRKLEVRFRDESRLFAAVAHAVREALLKSPLVRAAALPGMASPAGVRAAASSTPVFDGELLPLALAAREAPVPYAPAREGRLPSLHPLGQALGTYVVAEGLDGLYVIDQHAAHERVLYERLLAARRSGGVTRQGLTVPLAVELAPSHMATLSGHRDQLEQLGFEVEPFGPRTALLRAVPAPSARADPDSLLHRALAALEGNGEGGGPSDPLERATIATACHTAIRAGDRLAPEAIVALLADLAAAEDPFTCFHGRPTIVVVPRGQLERWFLRG
ncbi:MAG: DNA mismatch repair endonuclease MutL, partial [bacterium]